MSEHRMVIGLTGGIGVGKTTAAEILAELGAVVIDCDQLGRDVAAADGTAFGGIVERFGPDVVGENGELDRAKLASLVFNDPAALADLNGITHPAIDVEIERLIAASEPGARIVLDMAVLTESNLGDGLYERVLVIESPREQRLARLLEQRGMTKTDAEARMASQASDEQRRAVADDVVSNDGDRDALREALTAWWQTLPDRC